MKKTLIIALCCITVLIAACKKEKPYEKFIGEYEGTVYINGTMTVTGLYTQNLDNEPFELNFTLTQGTSDNQVILTYHPQGQSETYATTGTIADNYVDFEPITFNQNVDQSHVDATIDLEGTLSGNDLAMIGTMNGSGTLQTDQMLIPAQFTMNATLKGTVTKQVESPK